MVLSETVIHTGTGRRKSAIAQVKLISNGTGKKTINGQESTAYMQLNPASLWRIQGPGETVSLADNYDIIIKCCGGGLNGQAEAIQLGIAKALCKMKAANRYPLKAEGYLTRNSKVKERKKYGLKKARKAGQYSKR
jgi:small subunit ribosomal protein S9